MTIGTKIRAVSQFRKKLAEFGLHPSDEIRAWLNERAQPIRREVLEAGCLKTFSLAPPPAVGGLAITGADPFDMMFNPQYGSFLRPHLIDILDQTIGMLRAAPKPDEMGTTVTATAMVKGYVFVAMPMEAGRGEYDDVRDAIKAVADSCGLAAERVDEVESNERITDRVLESIQKAEYVIADLTNLRPNVFYEAGYAHALGKTPIYIARENTNVSFDLKDYQIIFFYSIRQLREGL